MRTRLTRIVAAAAFAGLLLTAIPAAAGAVNVDPSGAAFTKWGWVTVRHTSTGTYTPVAADRGNSAGRINVVKQTSVGHYSIVFKGIGDQGGVPHVSTLGSTPRICMINGWGFGTGTNEEVSIDCYTRFGVAASTRFSISFFATNVDSGPLAYVFGFGVTEEPTSQYSYNSGGGLNHITRFGAGQYTVVLDGLGSATGNVQVTEREGFLTAAGITPAGVNPVTCNAVSWYTSGSDKAVDMRCRNSQGMLVDAEFTLTFTSHEGLKGHGHGKVAYLWANKGSTSSYTPNASYRYSSAGTVPHITRQATGRYTVTLGGMPKGGAALVNAYGLAARRCQLGAIRTSGTPQQVQVRCFDFSGHAADARFSLSYER